MGGGIGGDALASRSRFSSADRRGGGGDGGWDAAASLGDRPVSMSGVCGRLGILKDRGEEATGVLGDFEGSGKRWELGSFCKTESGLGFGGD